MDPGNNLRRVREARMLSKAELARLAGMLMRADTVISGTLNNTDGSRSYSS